MVEGRRVLRDAKRIVRGQDVPELVDAELRRVLSEEHRHQARVLAELETLDLEVMLRDAEAGPAARVAKARVVRDLAEHPLVEHRILARHAALELVPTPDC